MPNMALGTSARAILDKSDLRNNKKSDRISQSVVSTPLWSVAATAGEVTKHAEGILQQQYLLATRTGGYSCVCINRNTWLVCGDGNGTYATLKKEEDDWYS